MTDIPVFSLDTARRLVQLANGPISRDMAIPLTNLPSNILLVRTTAEHLAGTTEDVEVLIGDTKGSEDVVVTTIPAFNRSDTDLADNTLALATNINQGLEILMGAGGSGGSGCGCTCIPAGDITVGGIETTSKWTGTFPSVEEEQANGKIVFPGGTYELIYNSGDGWWYVDVSDDLTAEYSSGNDATSATTMSADIKLRLDDAGSGYDTVKLTITGTVPAE
jgi:hypothetical protein